VSAQYTAFNGTVDATTGVMTAGTSYTTGAKCAIQIATLSTCRLKLIELGCTSFGTAGGSKNMITVAQAATASTMTSAHSTATITPTGDDTNACPLTMDTTHCGYGTGAITSTTTDRQFQGFGLDPAEHYEKQWPLNREFVVQPSKYLQVRVSVAATTTLLLYVIFELC
jgi:hypothetical protein